MRPCACRGGVVGVGESAFELVELKGGDAEIEEDAEEPLFGIESGCDLPYVVVDGAGWLEPRAEASEAFSRDAVGLGVPVDSYDGDGGVGLEERLGVTAHS